MTNANSLEKGLQDGWTRATFVLRKDYLSKLKAVSYWERKKIKEVIDEALRNYLKGKKIKSISNGGACMLRLCVGLLGSMFAVLLYCVPAAAIDGNASPVHNNSSNAVWSISAQTGFQHMDLNFKAPFVRSPNIGVELYTRSPLHLRLQNSNLWVNGIGADVKKSGFSGFFEWKANKPRDADVTAHSEPFWGRLDHVKWHDCHLKWWAINAGAGLDITDHFTIQAGLRAERLYLGLRNPVDRQGLIPYFHNQFGDGYRGHLESKLLIPWVGVQVQTSRLNGSLRFSPYAHTDLKIPFTYYFVATPLTAIEHQDYSFKHNGMWLEGSLAYDIYKTTTWSCSLWAQASWLWNDGRTYSTYQGDIYMSGSPIMQIRDYSSEKDGKYNTGIYGIGLRINYYF